MFALLSQEEEEEEEEEAAAADGEVPLEDDGDSKDEL